MANPFQEIKAEAGGQNRSADWYMKAVREYANTINTPVEVFNSGIGEFVNTLDVGYMYMFRYKPKTAAKMKYYDTFPLVLMSEPLPNGFSAINLHYLAPLVRADLLTKLLGRTRDEDINRETKAASDWRIIQNFMRFPEVRPSIKRYLVDQMQGKMLKIHQEHWRAAIMLPVHNFVGAGPSTVWRDSNKRPERKPPTGGSLGGL